MVGGRWVVRDGRHPREDADVRALPRRAWRASRVHDARAFDLLITGAHLATMAGDAPYGAIRDGAIGVGGERIAWVGAARDLPRDASARTSLDVAGRWATPGLVDCHTHLVYAGNRADEFEARLNGATYADIAQAGGGINATVARRARRATTSSSRRAGRGSRRWRARA